MKKAITILTLLMAMIMSTMTASAQFEKLSGVSVTMPAQTGTVTLTKADLLRTAAILRAEGVAEAPDSDYVPTGGRRPANLAELKAMDVKTLTSFLPVMAEACDRLATGVAVTYPSQERVDELVKAFREIKVLGPTGSTTVPEIKNAYDIVIAILQKRVVCSDPSAPAPAQPAQPASAQPVVSPPPTPVQPKSGGSPAPAQPAQAGKATQAQKAKAALAKLPPPPAPVGAVKAKP